MKNAANQRSLDVIVDDYLAQKNSNDEEKQIALCREGVAVCTSPNDELWYLFRILLANYLSSRTRQKSPEDIEEAIRICHELLSGLPLDAERKRANAQCVMGRAYNSRQRGNIDHNLQRAETARLAALKYFSRDVDAEQWAMLNTFLGALYLDLDDRNESDLVVDAIKCFENALEVFTAAANPELHEENVGLLREARNKARSRRILAD